MTHPPVLGMYGVASTGLPFTAGPSFQQAVMGQIASASSVADKQKLLQFTGSQQTLPQDTVSQADSDVRDSERDFDPPHRTYTDYETYIPNPKRRMMTQSSRLSDSERFASHDLVLFLRSTGPKHSMQPMRKPSKIMPNRAASVSRNALRFFGVGKRNTHDRQDQLTFFDEGGLLLPDSVQQKVSSTGKKYLALAVPLGDGAADQQSSEKEPLQPRSSSPPALGSDIIDSSVSIIFQDDIKTDHGSITEWYCYEGDGGRTSPVSPISIHLPSTKAGAEQLSERPLKLTTYSPTPIRPPASEPPTPPPESATSLSESYRCGLRQHPATEDETMDAARSAPRSASPHPRKPVTPMPKLALPHEEFPVKLPRLDRESELKHPLPRRLASHTVLLEESTGQNESSSDFKSISPAPESPPPKSPLRPKRDLQTIEQVLLPSPHFHKPTPKVAPTIDNNALIIARRQAIIPTVTTECTGPLTRSTPPKHGHVKHHLYPMSRKEREERTRARKLRDRPQAQVDRKIDAIVCAPTMTTKQRLRRSRPGYSIPGLVPAPLSTRSTSITSSDISWQCIDDASKTVFKTTDSPSLSASPLVGDHSAAATDSSPALSQDEVAAASRRASKLSALVAEQVSLTKARASPRATRVVVSKERVYTPRPRSASMPRLSGKRSSRTSCCESFRIATPPLPVVQDKDTPPLPSPPPNRALPPTPPASGSEGFRRKLPRPFQPSRNALARDGPSSPPDDTWPQQANGSIMRQKEVALNATERRVHPIGEGERMDAYVQALEKQNQLLHALLQSTLAAAGPSHTPLAAFLEVHSPKPPMTWETRITRRSEASHAASSSNGSALDMYMSTRTEG